ncbi:hypothetical protein [Streptomyces sp. CA-251251]|uniref:hypothetical protein n=1 Tax=Streptomyces sp. CA-251251 TaxID=3240063 RepID=UPI003D8F4876
MKDRAHSVLLRSRKPAIAFAGLCAALALTACGSSGDSGGRAEESSTPTRPPATTATADPQATAKKEALATYQAYWQEMEKLYADPTGQSARLDQYAASAALKNAEADAKRAHDRGRIYTGKVVVTEQTVIKADATGKVPNATVSSCLDVSSWLTVEAKTKKPVPLPSDRLTKYLISSTVEKYPEGWRVTSDEPQGKPC